MPRPAPRTGPVSSPITKLPPPPPSLSKRSYPSAIERLLEWFVGPWFLRLLEHRLNSGADAANQSDEAAGLGAHVRPYPVGRVVDAVHRRADRLIDPLGLQLDGRR